MFGVGVVCFNGARASARNRIVLVLYVAYSGQVIGGLFLGSARSAFFGALAITPVALFAARRPTGPSPLVTAVTSMVGISLGILLGLTLAAIHP